MKQSMVFSTVLCFMINIIVQEDVWGSMDNVAIMLFEYNGVVGNVLHSACAK